MPQTLAQALVDPFSLRRVAHPASLPPFKVGMLWHARVYKDSASQWLRNLTFETFVQ